MIRDFIDEYGYAYTVETPVSWWRRLGIWLASRQQRRAVRKYGTRLEALRCVVGR